MNSGFVALRQSMKSMRRNPARTALTTLGIVIGIATVIMVLSSGAGFRGLIDQELATLGANTLFVQTKVPSANTSRAREFGEGFSGVTITSLKQRDIDLIKTLPNVENGYGIVTGQTTVSYRGRKKSTIYYGASASRFAIDKSKLRSGRFYTVAEDTGADQVAILGSKVAQNLFLQQDPVGKLVRLGTLNYSVIGVYEPSGGLGGGNDEVVFIPLRTAQKKMLGIDHISMAIVQLNNVDQADSTAEQIRRVLRNQHRITNPDKDDFVVSTQVEAMSTFNTIFGGVTALLIAIAAISLLVGGVGIMNIMYVVVTERTAEIGLKKALGATRGAILREFLVESVMVTVLGGLIGIAAGAGLGWLVSIAARAGNLAWIFTVPLSAIVLGVSVSAVIGLAFGVLPAVAASKLDPIEALRYE
ncbi:FtsX-like permease family protein [Candidatus Uhrbacteria bacterium]|nr:FtsX-like permease family protein [Candidatus Uhrbacteria bacterium]